MHTFVAKWRSSWSKQIFFDFLLRHCDSTIRCNNSADFRKKIMLTNVWFGLAWLALWFFAIRIVYVIQWPGHAISNLSIPGCLSKNKSDSRSFVIIYKSRSSQPLNSSIESLDSFTFVVLAVFIYSIVLHFSSAAATATAAPKHSQWYLSRPMYAVLLLYIAPRPLMATNYSSL